MVLTLLRSAVGAAPGTAGLSTWERTGRRRGCDLTGAKRTGELGQRGFPHLSIQEVDQDVSFSGKCPG